MSSDESEADSNSSEEETQDESGGESGSEENDSEEGTDASDDDGDEDEDDEDDGDEESSSPPKPIGDSFHVELGGKPVVLTVFNNGNIKIHLDKRTVRKKKVIENPESRISDTESVPLERSHKQKMFQSFSGKFKVIVKSSEELIHVRFEPPELALPVQSEEVRELPSPPPPDNAVFPISDVVDRVYNYPQQLPVQPPTRPVLPPPQQADQSWQQMKQWSTSQEMDNDSLASLDILPPVDAIPPAPPPAASRIPTPPQRTEPRTKDVVERVSHDQVTQTRKVHKPPPPNLSSRDSRARKSGASVRSSYPITGVPPRKQWRSPVRRAHFPELPVNFAQKL